MKYNLHTHTTWCDGRDSPAAVAEAAIAKGFDLLGFSSHMSFPEAGECVLPPEKGPDYVADIRALAARQAGRLRVLCGAEADYIPGTTDPDRARYAHLNLDYLIGSIHYVIAPDGGRVPVDHAPELLAEGIRAHFGGDAEAYVHAYFRQQRDMVAQFDFDIVGQHGARLNDCGRMDLLHFSLFPIGNRHPCPFPAPVRRNRETAAKQRSRLLKR